MTCVFFAVLKSLEGHPELVWPSGQANQKSGGKLPALTC